MEKESKEREGEDRCKHGSGEEEKKNKPRGEGK